MSREVADRGSPGPARHPFEEMLGVELYPLASRPSLVSLDDFCRVPPPQPGFGDFVDSLPDIYAGSDFKELVRSIVAARRDGRPVVLAMGAHVLKVGLAPLVIDLMERGVVTDVALNSAGAIHDFEIATVGRTSERVDTQLPAGKFGFADETGAALAEAARRGAHPPAGEAPGFGVALGRMLLEREAPNARLSVPASAVRLGLGVTVHPAIGADIVHMHPAANGADLGTAALADFQRLCGRVAALDGGVWVNVGCAVILPEIFLKAVSVAINLGRDLSTMTTANLDMIRQYRAETNVVRRPPGRGITIIGQHELLLPLLRQALLAKLAAAGWQGGAPVSGARALERRLAELGRPRVLIVGDLIIDRYVTGDVTRISPEAPIPVLAVRSSELKLGGAGNVAANLRAMEAEVAILGVVGDDGHGRAMREMLERAGIDASRLIVDPTRPTIEKTRMMSGVQQMLRVDREDPRPVDGTVLTELLAHLPAAVAGADAVILSDYGKGGLPAAVLTGVARAGRERGVPVLVDPKGTDYSRYRGATLVTPNKREAETALGRRLTGPAELAAAADALIEAAELDLAVITLGSEGIYFRTNASGGPREGHVPAEARAVYDVTGAGDTVVAHLALYLASGFPIDAAIALANHAAGIVVGRLGTHSVTRAELAARLAEDLPKAGKVLDESTLDAALEDWRRKGLRIVFTNGCFDVLHLGHVEYLRFARSQGDVLLVGVNDDASVKRLKGEERPVNPLEDRLGVLAALEAVDAVVAFSEDTPKEVVERVTPDVLVKGEDWADKGVVGREWVETHGGRVVLAPLVPGRSTTDVLRRARGGAGVEGA